MANVLEQLRMRGQENGPIDPIEFIENKEELYQSPISFFDTELDGVRRFAILRTTEGGKYMRGNSLYYKLNGVEIYTEATNIIFVNLDSNTMFVRSYEKVANEIAPQNPEQKQYIILFTDLTYEDESTEFPFRWEAITGRTNAYDAIKNNAPVIDIDKSIIIVEDVPVKDALTIRQFMQYIKNGNLVPDTESFDINDYAGTNYV